MFYPGEVEYIREQQRRKSGIDVEDATWEKLAHWRASISWRTSWS